MADAVQYQSLYRRYRPQRFSEMLGQDHVVLALRNAVRENKAAHAYLFSGPRGTGKTSTARILAKALNCQNQQDGEPDGTCESCVSIQAGSSLDVHELDAASNNGVDAMRDLVSRTALGTPGRWKVYIVDEVHMLSTAASNALLKTLEEPPAHVVFVLATTDPQKVLPTIRSRTQHFEFRLLSPELLNKLVHQINGDANLHVPEEALDLVVRRGKGSARDTLSVLDQVAAAGIVDDETEVLDEIVESLCERDTGRALVAVAEAMVQGRDAQRVAVDLLEYLRNGFLSMMAKQLVGLPDNALAKVEEQARRLGAAALVRSMEAIGDALQEMRDAPEPRVTLEVALVRLTKPELVTDPASLLQRIERLEQGGVPAAKPKTAPTDIDVVNTEASPQAEAISKAEVEQPAKPSAVRQRPTAPESSNDNPAARPTLGALRSSRPAPAAAAVTPAPTAPQSTTPASGAAPAPTGAMPDRDSLEAAWSTEILEKLPQRARSRFRMGRFLSVANGTAVYALPNAIHKDRCEEVRNEVEAVLRSHYGTRVALQLVVEEEGSDPTPTNQQTATLSVVPDEEEVIDLNDTVVAEAADLSSPEARLLQAFPGAEEMS